MTTLRLVSAGPVLDNGAKPRPQGRLVGALAPPVRIAAIVRLEWAPSLFFRCIFSGRRSAADFIRAYISDRQRPDGVVRPHPDHGYDSHRHRESHHMFAHASGEWIASDWPSAPVAESGEPARHGPSFGGRAGSIPSGEGSWV